MLVNRLPRYLVPHRIVVIDELPLTPHGKIDETALAATDVAEGTTTPPETPTEMALAEAFTDVWELRTSTSRPAFCKWAWTASWPCRSCRPPAVVASRCGPG